MQAGAAWGRRAGRSRPGRVGRGGAWTVSPGLRREGAPAGVAGATKNKLRRRHMDVISPPRFFLRFFLRGGQDAMRARMPALPGATASRSLGFPPPCRHAMPAGAAKPRLKGFSTSSQGESSPWLTRGTSHSAPTGAVKVCGIDVDRLQGFGGSASPPTAIHQREEAPLPCSLATLDESDWQRSLKPFRQSASGADPTSKPSVSTVFSDQRYSRISNGRVRRTCEFAAVRYYVGLVDC